MWWRLVLLGGASVASALAQSVLEGIVYERLPDGIQQPLAGARLQWVGRQVGTLSGKNGRFRLVRPEGADTLRVTALGYRSLDTVLPASLRGELRLVLEAGQRLPDVSVEGTAPTISAAPVKTELITQRRLEESACCTLAESFERSATVEASFTDPVVGARQIQLLGLSGAYVQTLVEAVPVLRGLSLPFQWEYIPGPFLEGIAISKGATSVADGYEGLTGTISVDYRKPVTAEPVFVNLYASSLGRFEGNLIAARALGQSWQGMAFLSGRFAGWERDANGDGFIDMPLVRQLTSMVRLLRMGNPELQLLAKGLVEGRNGGTLRSRAPEQAYPVDFLGQRGELIAKGTLELAEEIQLGVRLAVVGQRLEATFGERRYRGLQQTGLLKALVLQEGNRFRLRSGGDLVVDLYDERFADTAWQRQEIVPGLFAEAEYHPHPSFLMVAGLRGDWHPRVGGVLTRRVYARWQPLPSMTLRLSAGRGMRLPNPVTDNLPFFLSARRVIFGSISPEWGWNYGGSLTFLVPLGSIWTVDLEAYRTEFRNQVVPDLDSSARLLLIRDVGHSSATSVLLQLEGTVLGTDVRLAYRWWDVWARTGGQWRRRPLMSPHRLLLTTSYAPAGRRWQLDATLAWNSGGRLPSSVGNPDSLRWAERFPAFWRLNAQLTRRLGAWDVYVGVENALNVLQHSAVIDPGNPRGPYFDASLVWGPLEERLFYIGIRWRGSGSSAQEE